MYIKIAGVPAPAEDLSPILPTYNQYTENGPECQGKKRVSARFCSSIRILNLRQEDRDACERQLVSHQPYRA